MLKITILLDHSNRTTFCPAEKRALYTFLIQVVSKLRVSTRRTLYRIGGFGSRACCLVPCSKEKLPFLYELQELSVSPHQEWTEKAKEDILTVLQGQPFPSLGHNDIRAVLKLACNGRHAADHVVVIASWPKKGVPDTWEVMQSVASVTLVNLKEKKPIGKQVLPPLNALWWVDKKTAERLAKKLYFATNAALITTSKEEVETLTVFEKKQLELIHYLFQVLPVRDRL